MPNNNIILLIDGGRLDYQMMKNSFTCTSKKKKNKTKTNKNKYSFYQQKGSDANIFLIRNQIKAVHRMIFTVVKKTLGLHETPKPLKGRQVELKNVLAWMIWEQLLHGLDQRDVEVDIKLDGRVHFGVNISLKFWHLY